jgi:SPP1 family predicted phage head-tail adaptor
MMVNGKYPRNVIIYQLTRVADGGGGHYTKWTQTGVSRAAIGTLSGSEYLQAQALQNLLSHRILMPFRDDIREEDRVVDEYGREYRVKAIINVNNRNKELEIHADSGVALVQEASAP